jgi:hypothetical protein
LLFFAVREMVPVPPHGPQASSTRTFLWPSGLGFFRFFKRLPEPAQLKQFEELVID